MFEMFEHPFMVRALLSGLFIAIPAAIIGATLVLRKNSMISDGLSHTAFGAMAVAMAIGVAPLALAIPVSILAAFVILKIGKNRRINGDAAIALMSTASLAIGVIAISLSGGVNFDLNSYLFGSVLAVSVVDVVLSGLVAAVAVVLYLFLHHRIFAITFDEEFARSIGIKTEVYNAVFAIIAALIVVVGMKLLGALLISSLIIFPTFFAMRFTKSFKWTVILAALEGVGAFLIGLVLSYSLNLPTGATVVSTHVLGLVFAYGISWITATGRRGL